LHCNMPAVGSWVGAGSTACCRGVQLVQQTTIAAAAVLDEVLIFMTVLACHNIYFVMGHYQTVRRCFSTDDMPHRPMLPYSSSQVCIA